MAERASEGAAPPAANCSINYLILSQRFQLQRISLAVVLLFVLEIWNNSLFTQTDNRGGDCEVSSVKRFSYRGFHECGSDLQLLSSKEPRLISGIINMFALWTNALRPSNIWSASIQLPDLCRLRCRNMFRCEQTSPHRALTSFCVGRSLNELKLKLSLSFLAFLLQMVEQDSENFGQFLICNLVQK